MENGAHFPLRSNPTAHTIRFLLNISESETALSCETRDLWLSDKQVVCPETLARTYCMSFILALTRHFSLNLQ